MDDLSPQTPRYDMNPMSPVDATKPVFWVSNKVMLKQAAQLQRLAKN